MLTKSIEVLIKEAEALVNQDFNRRAKFEAVINHKDFNAQEKQLKIKVYCEHADSALKVAEKLKSITLPSFGEHILKSLGSYEKAYKLLNNKDHTFNTQKTKILIKLVSVYLCELEVSIAAHLIQNAVVKSEKMHSWFGQITEKINSNGDLFEINLRVHRVDVKIAEAQAESFTNNGKFSEAITCYKNAIDSQKKLLSFLESSNPQNNDESTKLAGLYFALGKIYQQTKNNNDAILTNYNEALHIYNQVKNNQGLSQKMYKDVTNMIAEVTRPLEKLSGKSKQIPLRFNNQNLQGENMNEKNISKLIDEEIIKVLKERIDNNVAFAALIIKPYEQTKEGLDKTKEQIESYLKEVDKTGNSLGIMSDNVAVFGDGYVNKLQEKFAHKLNQKNKNENISTNGFGLLNGKHNHDTAKSKSHMNGEVQTSPVSKNPFQNKKPQDMDTKELKKLISDLEEENKGLKRTLSEAREKLIHDIIEQQQKNAALDEKIDTIAKKMRSF